MNKEEIEKEDVKMEIDLKDEIKKQKEKESLYLKDKRIINTIRIIERKIEKYEFYSVGSALWDVRRNIEECHENSNSFNEKKSCDILACIYNKIIQDGYLYDGLNEEFYLKEEK